MGYASSLFSSYQTPQIVVGTNPAANTEISQTIPAGELWDLVAVTVTLVQGATQTPQPILQFTDGTNVFLEIAGSTAAQAASTTCVYSWSRDFSTVTGQIGSGAGVHSESCLPEGLLLRPGWIIQTTTLGLGANSDYGAPIFYVRKGSHS